MKTSRFAIVVLFAAINAMAQPSNPPGSISQTINQMRISYFNIEGAGSSAITIVLKFENMNPRNPIAFAAKAQGSDGLADFWKMFPPVTSARLTDESGREYQLTSTTGLTFARDEKDWTIVNSGGSVPISYKFSGPSGGSQYNFSTDIRLVWGDEKGNSQLGLFQIYFPSLRR